MVYLFFARSGVSYYRKRGTTGGRQVLYLDRNFYPGWKALTTACQPPFLRRSNSAPCPCKCCLTCGTRLRSGTCHEACPRRQSARNRRSATHCPALFPFPGLTCTARPFACLARSGVQPTLVPFRFCSLPVRAALFRSIGSLLLSSLTRRPAGRASCQPQDNSQRVFLPSHQQHAQRSQDLGTPEFNPYWPWEQQYLPQRRLGELQLAGPLAESMGVAKAGMVNAHRKSRSGTIVDDTVPPSGLHHLHLDLAHLHSPTAGVCHERVVPGRRR
jgi:hypothetical protein